MQFIRVLVMLVVAGFVLSGCITAKPMEEKAEMAMEMGDDDGDGVLNDADECPDTRPGVEVDFKGCEIIVTLSSLHFAFDSAALTPQAEDILSGILAVLSQHDAKAFEIAGHTDSVGPEAYNMQLGERRATSVLEYLLENGIENARVEVISYGESRPIESNDTKEGRAANRRVEVVDVGTAAM